MIRDPAMLISVVIPTHSRPELLEEAVISVRNQSYAGWELVIIDDGSAPPVDCERLENAAGRKITLVRHENAKGVVASKNAGIENVKGDIVLYLDDDDLLTPDALETIARAYCENPRLDCVFMNIEVFGQFAAGSGRNQADAMAKLLSRVSATETGELIVFDAGLVDALLRSVPLAFQRPAVRTSLLQRIGPMPETLLFAEPEWTILAAMLGKTALTKRPISKWRVDGQNFVSRPEMAFRQMQRGLMAREWLWKVVRNSDMNLATYGPRVKAALSMSYQDASSYAAHQCHPLGAIRYGLKSFYFNPTLPKAKLLFLSIPYGLVRGCLSKYMLIR